MAVTRTAKGTAVDKTTTTTLTLSSVTITDGASVIVGVTWNDTNSRTISSLTWNGVALSEEVKANNSTILVSAIYALHDATGATGDVVVTWNDTVPAKVLFCTQLENLAASPFDKSSSGTGTSTNPLSGATATTAQADEMLIGCICHRDEIDDARGTWQQSFNAGQNDGTNGGSDASNRMVFEGFLQVTATGTYEAETTGIDSTEWVALIATYKEASGATPLTITVGDNLSNWDDSLGPVAHGHKLTDTLSFSDAFKALMRHFLTVSGDLNNLNDDARQVIGYMIAAASSNSANWQDAIVTHLVVVLKQEVGDDIDNWDDAIAKVFGYNILKSDTMSQSDAVVKVLGLLKSEADAFILSDDFSIVLGKLVTSSDDLNNLLDAINKVYGYLITNADNMDNLADAISVNLVVAGGIDKTFADSFDPGFADAVAKELSYIVKATDALSLTDARVLVLSYLKSFSDQITITDAISKVLGIVLKHADAITLSDSSKEILAHLIIKADDLNNWNDTVAINLILPLQQTFSDSLDNWADAINTDLAVGDVFVKAFSDDLNNWLDAITLFMTHAKPFADDLNSWSDTVSKVLEYQKSHGDTMRQIDQVYTFMSHAMSKADSIENWLDSITLSRLGLYAETFGDDLNNWNDSITRFMAMRAQLTDNLRNYQDSVLLSLGKRKAVSDNLDNWMDAVVTNLILEQTQSAADDLNNWSDSIVNSLVVRSRFFKAAMIPYLRRYLNDVVGLDTSTHSVPLSVAITKADMITYLRRYLNDVV